MALGDKKRALMQEDVGAADGVASTASVNTTAGNLATVEASSTASKAYAAGEYLVYHYQLYKASAAIAQGDTLEVGVNLSPVVYSDEVKAALDTKTPVYGFGENILINADFRKPVNQNGKTEHSTGYGIDRWYMSNCRTTLNDDSITLTGTAVYGNFSQTTDILAKPGARYTLSALVDGGTGVGDGAYLALSNVGVYEIQIPISSSGLVSASFIASSTPQTSGIVIAIVTSSLSGRSLTVKAAKLELGSTQTLAHNEGTDENPVWVLNAPVDYDKEYLRCLNYAPTTGAWSPIRKSNPNLFDNGYFVGGGSQQGGGQFPINQQWQTSYTGAGYGIDRWKCTVEGMTINSNGISISPNTMFGQIIENQKQILTNKRLTFSALLSDGSLVSGTKTVDFTHDVIFNDNGNVQVLFWYNGGSWFSVFNKPSNQSNITTVAVKLELGDMQTLAHQENGVWVLNEMPNYQQELAKCQRYYQLYATQSLRPSNAADCRPVMRTTPAQGTISIDGTTYYYNDSNL